MKPLSRLGEFALIKRFRKAIRTDSSVVKGSGDDCAVLKLDRKNYQLFTCDMLVEGVDFKHSEDPFLIGRKSVAVSLSDIASCAGIPRHCLVSLAAHKNTSIRFIDRLFKGMLSITKRYKINLVGGDLSSSDKLVIDVSMLGSVEKRNLALRSGAKPKDVIFVTGELGGSIRGRHLRFIPRVKEARWLAAKFKIGAMIDISDGLLQDLGHILEQSRVGAVIFEELLPLSRQARNINEALDMGEDFELLFTLSRKDAASLLSGKQKMFKPIGEIVESKFGLRLIDLRNKERVVKIKGFSHFR